MIYRTCFGAHHYTPLMPQYMPLHTLYAFVHTPLHITRLGIHSTCLDTQNMSWYTLLYALVHTTAHVTCLGTHYYSPYTPCYTPLHMLHVLVHTTTCVIYMLLLHNAQLHPTLYATPLYNKDELCALFFLNNSNSIRLTKLKLTEHVVCVLIYIHSKLQLLMIMHNPLQVAQLHVF